MVLDRIRIDREGHRRYTSPLYLFENTLRQYFWDFNSYGWKAYFTYSWWTSEIQTLETDPHVGSHIRCLKNSVRLLSSVFLPPFVHANGDIHNRQDR